MLKNDKKFTICFVLSNIIYKFRAEIRNVSVVWRKSSAARMILQKG